METILFSKLIISDGRKKNGGKGKKLKERGIEGEKNRKEGNLMKDQKRVVRRDVKGIKGRMKEMKVNKGRKNEAMRKMFDYLLVCLFVCLIYLRLSVHVHSLSHSLSLSLSLKRSLSHSLYQVLMFRNLYYWP